MTLALLMAIALVCVRKWQKSIAYVACTVPETAGYRPWTAGRSCSHNCSGWGTVLQQMSDNGIIITALSAAWGPVSSGGGLSTMVRRQQQMAHSTGGRAIIPFVISVLSCEVTAVNYVCIIVTRVNYVRIIVSRPSPSYITQLLICISFTCPLLE